MTELNVYSEVQPLKAVLIHTPGAEVENMTPATAERALYSDILNLSVASKEFVGFKEVLNKVTQVYELKDLLCSILQKKEAQHQLIQELFTQRNTPELVEFLRDLTPSELTQQLIEGVPYPHLSLSNFLRKDPYLIPPLHNAFFTRDSAFVYGNDAIISSMASPIRRPEPLLMQSVFRFHQQLSGGVIDIPENKNEHSSVSIEGGDVLIFQKNILIIGISKRSSPAAIDTLLTQLTSTNETLHVLLQELPSVPESFIHLDMVFTLINHDECVIYEPLILEDNRYNSIHIEVNKHKITKICYVDNLLDGLKQLGYSLNSISCGGKQHNNQEREQWHSGANLLAFAPGKAIAYERNIHTLEALNQAGYRIVPAEAFVKATYLEANPEKIIVAIKGSELARGGGGPRCMTLPLCRK